MRQLVFKTYHLANAVEQELWRRRPEDGPRVFYSMYFEQLVRLNADGMPVFESIPSLPSCCFKSNDTVVQWSIVTYCDTCFCANCDDCVCDMPPLSGFQ